MRTYKPKTKVLTCRFNGLDYMFSVRLPSGTVNWVKARRTKAGKWSITWPVTQVKVEGKTVLKQAFVPAPRITEYVIDAFERYLTKQSTLKSIEASETIEREAESSAPSPTEPDEPDVIYVRKKGPPGTRAFCPDCGQRVRRTRDDDPDYIECSGCHRAFNASLPEYERLLWKEVEYCYITPCCKAKGRQVERMIMCSKCGREYDTHDDSLGWQELPVEVNA